MLRLPKTNNTNFFKYRINTSTFLLLSMCVLKNYIHYVKITYNSKIEAVNKV